MIHSHVRGSAEPPLRDITLGELLAWAARTASQRLALVSGDADPAARRQWSYAELHAQALRTAQALAARFAPGERVAIWAPNIPEWVLMEFGTAMAGVVLVTVNPGFRASEVEYVLKQSRAAGVFVVRGFRGYRGGENIYPRELEELLFRHPTVAEVAVIGLPDEKWGEEVGAFIRPAPGAALDKAALFSYMREHLAPH